MSQEIIDRMRKGWGDKPMWMKGDRAVASPDGARAVPWGVFTFDTNEADCSTIHYEPSPNDPPEIGAMSVKEMALMLGMDREQVEMARVV